MTDEERQHCDHQCVCPEWTDLAQPCDANTGGVFVCSHDTRARGQVHSGAQQQAPIPVCPNCQQFNYLRTHPDEKSPNWILIDCDYCGYHNAVPIITREHDAAIAAQAAAAERGQVLKKMCEQCPVREEIPTDDPRCAESCEGCLARMVCGESLRSQPKKQQYCKHLKWLTQVEGGGEYRCELGNKTSDEWCYKKERCGDYELVPECGACTGPDPLDVLEQFIKENQRNLNEEEGYEPPMLDVPPFMIIDVDDIMGKIAELRQQGK